MEKLKATYPIDIVWRSYELRPAGTPLPDSYRERILAMRPQMIAMARERYGLEIDNGPFGIDSRPALIGAKYAESQGMGAAYHEAVFRAYWQQAQDISNLDVLAQIAESVGLERPLFLDALTNSQYAQQVRTDIEQAFQYGLSGVPALVFDMKYLVVGAQPYEMLSQVTEKALAERLA